MRTRLHSTNVDAVRAILHYLHTDQLEVPDNAALVELLEVADMIDLPRLKVLVQALGGTSIGPPMPEDCLHDSPGCNPTKRRGVERGHPYVHREPLFQCEANQLV